MSQYISKPYEPLMSKEALMSKLIYLIMQQKLT